MRANWRAIESTSISESEGQARKFPAAERELCGGGAEPIVRDVALEKHYAVWELAQLWGLSEKTIRRMFLDEPGVVKLGHEESRFKRAYMTLRIPESVVQRVHRRLTQA